MGAKGFVDENVRFLSTRVVYAPFQNELTLFFAASKSFNIFTGEAIVR